MRSYHNTDLMLRGEESQKGRAPIHSKRRCPICRSGQTNECVTSKTCNNYNPIEWVTDIRGACQKCGASWGETIRVTEGPQEEDLLTGVR